MPGLNLSQPISQSKPGPYRAKRRRSINDLAREALERHDNCAEESVEDLLKEFLGDMPLVKAHLREILYAASQSAVNQCVLRRRMAIMESNLANEAARLDLLDFPLAGGTLLRYATREEVLKQAKKYNGLSADSRHKAAWLYAVATTMPERARVGKVLSTMDVRMLFDTTKMAKPGEM